MTCCPKFLFAIGLHSPLAFGFRRSQSGTRLLLRSFHDRLVLATMAFWGLKVLLITHDTKPT